MIGSLDILTKSSTTQEFQQFIDGYHGMYPIGQKHYSAMFMKPLGLPVAVHFEHSIFRASKIQYLDMPSLTLDTCSQVFERLFEACADDQRVVRLHLGCDVPDVPVSWFRESMRVRYKQNSDLYGRVNSESAQQRVQTLYFGGKTNGFTVYDKVAERLNDHRRRVRKAKKSAVKDFPSFEQLNGFEENAIRTRIERKFNSQGIPENLNTVGQLAANVSDFDPFSNLVFCPSAELWPCLEKLGLQLYRKVVTFQQEQKRLGFDAAYKRLHTFSGKNGAREFKPIAEAINKSANEGVTADQLLALYKMSVTAQVGTEKQ